MNIILNDARVIGTLGPYGVRAGMHEVHLRDDSLHRLHLVQHKGERSMHLCALQLADGQTYSVFDLRDLAPGLHAEIPTYLERDVPGLVKYTLRGLYPTGQLLRAAIAAQCSVTGIPEQLVSGVAA